MLRLSSKAIIAAAFVTTALIAAVMSTASAQDPPPPPPFGGNVYGMCQEKQNSNCADCIIMVTKNAYGYITECSVNMAAEKKLDFKVCVQIDSTGRIGDPPCQNNGPTVDNPCGETFRSWVCTHDVDKQQCIANKYDNDQTICECAEKGGKEMKAVKKWPTCVTGGPAG